MSPETWYTRDRSFAVTSLKRRERWTRALPAGDVISWVPRYPVGRSVFHFGVVQAFRPASTADLKVPGEAGKADVRAQIAVLARFTMTV